MNELTENEKLEFEHISNILHKLRICVSAPFPDIVSTSAGWFSYINDIKQAQGNINNVLSFLSCLMAKEYLCKHHSSFSFDASGKKQGASGSDMHEILRDGSKIIGEIKNTIPYMGDDFGAAQWDSLEKDFGKLRRSKAKHKYFFMTDNKAYEILKGYPEYIRVPRLKVVLLPSGKSFSV